MKRYKAISRVQVNQILSFLPSKFHLFLKGSIECSREAKFDSIMRDFIRGQYAGGSGKIFIYGFKKKEILNFEYVDVVYHEIGHKIFQEVLSREDKGRWAISRPNHFPIKLDDVYLKEELWEEEYCIVFSLIMMAKFYRKLGMVEKAKRITGGLKSMRRAVKTIERILEKAASPSTRPSGARGDYPQKIHRRILKWVDGR